MIELAITIGICSLVTLFTAYFAYRATNHIIKAIKEQLDESYADKITDKVINSIKQLIDNNDDKH